MKKLSALLWFMTILMFIAGIYFAYEAHLSYEQYDKYTYGKPKNEIDKLYGDLLRTAAIVQFVSCFISGCCSTALDDAEAKLESLKKDIHTLSQNQTAEFDALQGYLEKSSELYMNELKEIKAKCSSHVYEEKQPIKRSRLSHQSTTVTSAPPNSEWSFDTPDRR